MNGVITGLSCLSENSLVSRIGRMTNARVFAKNVQFFDCLRNVTKVGIGVKILLNTGFFSVIHGSGK